MQFASANANHLGIVEKSKFTFCVIYAEFLTSEYLIPSTGTWNLAPIKITISLACKLPQSTAHISNESNILHAKPVLSKRMKYCNAIEF